MIQFDGRAYFSNGLVETTNKTEVDLVVLMVQDVTTPGVPRVHIPDFGPSPAFLFVASMMFPKTSPMVEVFRGRVQLRGG